MTSGWEVIIFQMILPALIACVISYYIGKSIGKDFKPGEGKGTFYLLGAILWVIGGFYFQAVWWNLPFFPAMTVSLVVVLGSYVYGAERGEEEGGKERWKNIMSKLKKPGMELKSIK